MKKILFTTLFMLPGFCLGEELKELPSFYLKPEFHSMFAEHPLVVDNGYVELDSVQMAQRFIDPLPPDADFDSDNVIIFAWLGSGEDKIEYTRDDTTYHFVYKRGMTKDLRQHVKLFVIKKNHNWLYHRVLE